MSQRAIPLSTTDNAILMLFAVQTAEQNAAELKRQLAIRPRLENSEENTHLKKGWDGKGPDWDSSFTEEGVALCQTLIALQRGEEVPDGRRKETIIALLESQRRPLNRKKNRLSR